MIRPSSIWQNFLKITANPMFPMPKPTKTNPPTAPYFSENPHKPANPTSPQNT